MMSWDLARLWHTLAGHHPDRPALIHGSRTLTWRQFDTAAAGFARILRQTGIRRGDVVALCLPNVLEYLVLVAGTMRCGATPCGINYRYRPHEFAALLRHLRPAVVCHPIPDRTDDGLNPAVLPSGDADGVTAPAGPGDFANDVPGVRLWYTVDPRAGRGDIDRLLEAGAGPDRLDSDPGDTLLKCTGGTTGHPLAVRWRIADVLTQLNNHNPWHRHDLTARLLHPALQPPVRLAVASPLMHGSGLTRAFGALCAGGTVITLPGTSFDPGLLLDTLTRHRVTSLAIVGDAHALPLADAVDAAPRYWQLPDLTTITSSGAVWTSTVKRRLLDRVPRLQLLESLGATEATGLGFSVATTDAIPATGEFVLGRHARIFAEGRPAQPGKTGTIGVSWPHPTGLHPAGSLPPERFIAHDGHRYLSSGDEVRRLDDHRFLLLGRPEDCINTGGEKVHAPEVADTLRRHPAVRDTLVIAVPHPRLGQTVVALVELTPGASADLVRAHARANLAGFKAPTVVIEVSTIPRTGTGKPDTTAARELAAHHLGDAQ